MLRAAVAMFAHLFGPELMIFYVRFIVWPMNGISVVEMSSGGGFATFGGYYPSSECVSQFQIVGPIQRFRPPAGAGGLIVAYQ